MPITLKDIAARSGFSVTTVSRALGGYDDVNENTRAHIISVAQELGYHPNLIARQLQSQNTQTIGMIAPASLNGLHDDFFSLLIKSVTQTAARHHYDLLISAQLPDDDEMDAYRRIVGGRRVDGVILARTHQDDARITYLKSVKFPFVVAGRAALGQPADFPHISADSQAGIQQLVRHFVAYGHQHIGLVLPPPSIVFTAYRLLGYQDGLRDAGLAYDAAYVIHSDLTRQGGYKAAQTLLARDETLTAIIACNDLMALGAIEAIQANGRVVGEHVAVGGFDDIPQAQHAGLTTLRQPIYDIGEQLTVMLLQLIAGQAPAQTGILLEPQLIVRASSGQAR